MDWNKLVQVVWIGIPPFLNNGFTELTEDLVVRAKHALASQVAWLIVDKAEFIVRDMTKTAGPADPLLYFDECAQMIGLKFAFIPKEETEP